MHTTLTYPALLCVRFFIKEGVRGYRFGFNGQMKDDEVYGEGNSYTAEYWQYDPRLGRRWNLDPIPQITISDYSCFKDNPLIYSDVSGAKPTDDYGIDKKGHVKLLRKTNDKFDRLYATDSEGKLNSPVKPITVNDKSILPQLAEKKFDKNGKDEFSSVSSFNLKEVAEVFVFAVQNTEVEWSMNSYKTHRGPELVLSTMFDEDEAPNPASFGYSQYNELINLHVHPGKDGTKGGSGDVIGNGYVTGDIANIINRKERYDKRGMELPPHYVLHKHSKGLYQYTPTNYSIFVKRIFNAKDLYFLFSK